MTWLIGGLFIGWGGRCLWEWQFDARDGIVLSAFAVAYVVAWTAS